MTSLFSNEIETAAIGAAESLHAITATGAECAGLARRFGLLALDSLAAEVRLKCLDGGLIRLTARLRAAVVQECVVTLEPVPSRIEEEFSLLYGHLAAEREVVLDGAAETVEPIDGGRIDIAEAVAQQLSLALDPFPRRRGLIPSGQAESVAPLEKPFSSLKDLLKPGESER